MKIKKVLVFVYSILESLIFYVDEMGTLLLKVIGWTMVVYFLSINDVKPIPITIIMIIIYSHIARILIESVKNLVVSLKE